MNHDQSRIITIIVLGILLLIIVACESGCADDGERQVCAPDGGGYVTRCGLPE
jgi:hypothetical protein